MKKWKKKNRSEYLIPFPFSAQVPSIPITVLLCDMSNRSCRLERLLLLLQVEVLLLAFALLISSLGLRMGSARLLDVGRIATHHVARRAEGSRVHVGVVDRRVIGEG